MPYSTETDKVRERVIPFLNGIGLDLGCREIKISSNAIGIDLLKNWDAVDLVGDASNLQYVIPKGKLYDWIFSSHLLEHLKEKPKDVVKKWLSFIKQNGYLILYQPDVEYYTQINPEHIYNFTAKQWFEELKNENIIIYEKRNKDTNRIDEYSVLIVIQK